jgi:hypothetical protein
VISNIQCEEDIRLQFRAHPAGHLGPDRGDGQINILMAPSYYS